MANTGEGVPPRSVVVTQGLAIVLPLLTIAGGIWAAAAWTGELESKIDRLEYRVLAIEGKIDGAKGAYETRIDRLEYRLNWLDEEKNRDRNERRQIDQDIREGLRRLENVVIRLEANAPRARRR